MTRAPTRSRLVRVRTSAGRVVPGHSVAVARMVFGAVAVVSAARILAHGWVAQLWSDPGLLLGWPLLPVPVLPHGALVATVVAVGLSGAAIAAGLRTRAAAVVFLVAFSYLELLDRTTYLNHYWAMTLLAVLLATVPTDDTWSLARRVRGGAPALPPPAADARPRATTQPRTGVPAWVVWLLRAQVATIYVGAAVAKLDPDWLLRGQPLGMWLAARADLPVVGGVLALPGAGVAASWAGLLFDLTIVFWLWWRPTRVPAVLAVVAFHAVTWVLFPGIGVFPLLMVGLATIWLPPGWPAAVTARVAVAAELLAPGPRRLATGSDVARKADRPRRGGWSRAPVAIRTVRWRTLALCAAWILVQVLLPLRHLAIPGDVRWTEEGGRFAWRVMAEEKVGWATFTLTDPAGDTTRVGLTDVLTPNQAHVAAVRPDLLHQVAGALADRATAATGVRPEVRVDARVAWNGRPNAPLIDPAVDLAAQPWRSGRHQPWILEPPS